MVVVSLFAIIAGPGLWARCFGEGVVSTSLIGQTDLQIVRESGMPASDRPGYRELGPPKPHLHLRPNRSAR